MVVVILRPCVRITLGRFFLHLKFLDEFEASIETKHQTVDLIAEPSRTQGPEPSGGSCAKDAFAVYYFKKDWLLYAYGPWRVAD